MVKNCPMQHCTRPKQYVLNLTKQKATERKILNIEKNIHYKRISDLGFISYDLCLKLAKQMGNIAWNSLEEKLISV